MNTAHASARPANDTTTWVLFALVACLAAAALGWGIARMTTPSWNDVQRDTTYATQSGQLAGQSEGYGLGVKAGRRDAQLAGAVAAADKRRTSYNEGYSSGYQVGRARAIAKRGSAAYDDPEAFVDPTLGMTPASTSAAFPAESFDQVLAGTDLGTQASGFAPNPNYSTTTFGADALASAPASTSSDWYRGGSAPCSGC